MRKWQRRLQNSEILPAGIIPLEWLLNFSGDLVVIPMTARFTMPEMSENAGQIVASVRTAGPAIPDAEIGYGNGINLVWTIREYETQFAELHIEDQGFPAKSGHLD